MHLVTRRRAIWLLGLMLGCYALGLILVALALGFDHDRGRWPLAGGLMLLAVGTATSVLMRGLVLRGWWTTAPPSRRALVLFGVLVRLLAIVIFAGMAVRTLSG